MTDGDRCKADPDLISEGAVCSIRWEVRVCDSETVTMEVEHFLPSGECAALQHIALSHEAADAIGPALVLAAKRLKKRLEAGEVLYCPACSRQGFATRLEYKGQHGAYDVALWYCRYGHGYYLREQALELADLSPGLKPWPETEEATTDETGA